MQWPRVMPNRDRIAELEGEILSLRGLMESHADAEIRALSERLIQKIQKRIQSLK
jgi:hypothetical protein